MKKPIVLILSCLLSVSVMAADLPKFPFVTASGTAEKKAAPDMATVHLSILAFEKESDLALKVVNDTATQAIQVLTQHGVSKDKIEATDIRKNTIRKRDSEYNNLEILGYEVSRSMVIKLDNLAQYSDIMGKLIGTNNVSGVRADFDVSNRKELEAELMAIAGADAKEKASAMANGLNAKIHSVYAISQGSFGTFNVDFGAGAMKTMAFRSAEGAGAYETIMFAPETITVEQSINVIFRIK